MLVSKIQKQVPSSSSTEFSPSEVEEWINSSVIQEYRASINNKKYRASIRY